MIESKYTPKQMEYSVPNQPSILLYNNQQVVIVNKSNYIEDRLQFLQVGINEWQEACRTLSNVGFKLYLYLCSNTDGFQMALFPTDIEKRIGLSKTSYYKAKKELKEYYYITEKKANGKTLLYDVLNFYTDFRNNPEYKE